MFKRTYKGNIPLLAGLEFTSYFGITSFWILFFIQNGLSLLQIGLLESIFHGTSLLCEIPSGMLADRFSYKTNLYLARLASIVSSILILFGKGNFWIYAVAMMVNAGPTILIRGPVPLSYMIRRLKRGKRIDIFRFLAFCLVWQKSPEP